MSTPLDPAQLRRDYRRATLSEADLAPDPHAQFARWLAEAVAADLPEPTAMILATAASDGTPSARTVLLKGLDERGFAFFTSLGSRKGRELAANPKASLCFPWFPIERQVVVCGAVRPVERGEVEAYFRTRPHGSRLGAWASAQSTVIESREPLEARFAELADRWPDEVPVPPHWGGFRVVPDTVEFWAGRESRLHDRLRYRRAPAPAAGWVVERLSP